MNWGRIFNSEIIEMCPPGRVELFPAGFFVEVPDNAKAGDIIHEGVLHPKPDYAVEFDFDALEWRIDEAWKAEDSVRVLAEAKAGKVAAIDARTAELIKQGFTFSGKQFSMSNSAQQNWNALSSDLANGLLSFPLTISTADGSSYILKSSSKVKEFLGARLAYLSDSSQPLGTGRYLKEQVMASKTVEDLAAIIDER